MKRNLLFSFILIFLFIYPKCKAQIDTANNISFSFNADIVSRYIWRGLPLNLNPNIQPYASLTYKNLTFGAWGSYAIAEPYAEVDLYLSYTASIFTITLNDYYLEEETDLPANDFFQYRNYDTACSPHALEASISFDGTDNLPLYISASTMFYGNDVDDNNENYYSTYIEASYEFEIGENSIELFLGGTPGLGIYAENAAIVNTGINMSREIQIGAKFGLPVNSSLILNPNAKNIFFVFGFTF